MGQIDSILQVIFARHCDCAHHRNVAVCVVGAALAVNGTISFGVIVAFMMYVRFFTQPLSQASIVFNVACGMVEQCPALKSRIKPLMSQKRLLYKPLGSFYQVLSAEAYTKHGLNVHGVVFDELHAQPSRQLYDVMTHGSGDARKLHEPAQDGRGLSSCRVGFWRELIIAAPSDDACLLNNHHRVFA